MYNPPSPYHCIISVGALKEPPISLYSECALMNKMGPQELFYFKGSETPFFGRLRF